MYPIVRREKLADKIYLMDVKAPRVAQYCEPGQFVIVKIDEEGERIPLTICDYDREAGTITIVFQTVGASTERMAYLQEGDAFQDFVGPLGCASDLIDEDIEELKKKKILIVVPPIFISPSYQTSIFLLPVHSREISFLIVTVSPDRIGVTQSWSSHNS